ncbi:hypothetical protein MED121_05453 [Marinomonas sp. MED121]|uniref:DsrH/TusB family sulfur metabolism protein n=1 Tax=Marinomonas sp. MED121 TaxID=314277 RepID=UPI000068FC11|nr:DsrH/TusB family sulfur metabolism protein [Marinomonas sp. MED121]EAQ63807.1 hypothetical protein MED121_05453 [Marinomonas sp. MED121]
MPRLHQLNQAQYIENTENELKQSLNPQDALILIEEAVLRTLNNDALINYAKSLNVKVFALEEYIESYGIKTNKVEIITPDQWLVLTADFEQHTAW